MLLLIYRLIILVILGLVIWNLYDYEKKTEKINATIVIIPFLLRMLMVK